MKYKNIDLIWLGHSGFKISSQNRIIYIDPFKIPNGSQKADFIFCTHSHYDHFSVEDIQKIAKEGTIIVCTADSQSKMRHIDNNVHIQLMSPGDRREFDDISVWTIPAYNTNKPHHTREEDWIGFIIKIDNVLIYHAGDTDLIPEMKKLAEIDIALLPVGGVATMNAGEAAKAALLFKPKLAIPMHYGTVAGFGSKSDAEIFAKYCQQEGLEAKILEVGDNEHFTKRKQDCLKKQDKSSIGSWDKPILNLCEKINKLDNYYTLSSCSGRIVLIKNIDKKEAGMFIFRSHEKINFDEIFNIIKNYKGKENLIFKLEPCILHVACKTIDNADKMLTKARYAGWKNSGIMSIANSRIVLELRSTEALALPIFSDKKLIVDNNFLKILIKESNKKLEKTWQKIENLEKSL